MIHGGEIYDKTIEYDFSVNLNPLPCPKEVISALEKSLQGAGRYPDFYQNEFRDFVARAENKLLGKDLLTIDNIIGGNGASELLLAIIRMIAPRKVLLPVPGFSGYMHALRSLDRVTVYEFLLKEEQDFRLTKELVDAINYDTDLVIIADPNNPTGKNIDKDVLLSLMKRCKETDTWLLIDECFLRMSDKTESSALLIPDMPRLFVVNAYTKLFSIPGVRVGYVLASWDNINSLRNYLPEWNMSVFAQNAGRACADILLANDYIRMTTDYIKEQRDKLSRTFEAKSCKVYPSDTNFFLVKSDENLYEHFLQEKILIRDCANFVGLSKGFYRIAVKTEKENLRIMELLQSGIV